MSSRDARRKDRQRRDRYGEKKKLSTGAWVAIIVSLVVVIIVIAILLWLLVLRNQDNFPDPNACTAAPPAVSNPRLTKTVPSNTIHTINWDDPGGEQGYDAVLVRHWYNDNCSGSVSDTQIIRRGIEQAIFEYSLGTSQGDHCYRLETRNPCGFSDLVPDEPYLTSTV